MAAREKLQDVLRGNYNLEFEVVEILKDGVSIPKSTKLFISAKEALLAVS